ncbi:MAG TPA: type I secretion system permease/ATPase, partial [Geminicoccus sp.]|uniref:type I secretion system permease/ATPase n=1 Tax=Geminicoccus sp. TaxID=2024832 RepID=UPI002E337A09
MRRPDETNADISPVRALRNGLLPALAASFALNLLMLALPLYSLQLYDRVLSSGHVETLLLLSGIGLFALLALGAFEAVRNSILARLAIRFEAQMTGPVVEAALERGVSGAQGLRDLGVVRQMMAGPAITALFDAPWLPLALIASAMLDPSLAIFGLASAVLLMALALLNARITRTSQARAGQAQIEAQVTADAIGRHADAIRSMGMAASFHHRIGSLQAEALLAQQQMSERGGLVMGVTRVVRLAVQGGIMGLGAWLVLQNELTPGGMMAASILLGKALAPVEQMVGVWRQVALGRESLERLRQLLDRAPMPARTSLPEPKGRLALEGVTLHAADGRPLLRNISLALAEGDCLAVVGASGAGKSTLCRVLTGIATPEAGCARLDGAALEHYPRDELGRSVGYLPQEPMLFAATVAQNIARMQPDAPAEGMVAAAKMAGAHEMILRLPQGYDTRLADGGAPLSGGQRQLLGLARALYGRPRLVVLDEPNANLDSQGDA